MSDFTTSGGCPFFRDPEQIFQDLAEVRTSGGLPYSEVYGARMVTAYDDVVTALHDPATFSSAPTVPVLPSPWRERFDGKVPDRGTLIGVDEPDHDRLRSAVNGFFVPRRLARFEGWIREQAHRLIDGFVEDGRAEFKTAFARPLPLITISHIVGLDPDRAGWIGEALGFFLGPGDVHHTGTPEEKAQKLLDLHEYVRDVMAERRRDRRDDLISHVWDQRDSGTVEMTDFEMLSLIPGLMLAGHETSSNLICTVLSHLLPVSGRWAAAQRDDTSRAKALEEFLRFESAITGMRRLVTTDTTLGGVPLHAGEQLFLAYASGSRDSAKFAHPDEIDFERTWSVPHLGFGQGVHACLGAPLARLLLRIELGVLHERLPDLALAVPAEELEHTPVAEARGITFLPLTWTPSPRRSGSQETPTGSSVDVATPVVVAARRLITEDVVELTLTAEAGVRLPEWRPGAHVDLELPDGSLRQYSLCGMPGLDELRIAVLREPSGRGGSVTVHDQIRVADRLRIRGPRNHFCLRPADFVLFVAGGIGITPLLPMIDEVERRGTGWRLLYLGKSHDRMPYLDTLLEHHRSSVYSWPSSERGRYDLDDLWARMPAGDSLVYACGPEALLAGLEHSSRRHGFEDRVVVERFAAREVEHEPNRAIDVVLARSGRTITVAEHRSVLDAINEAGADVLSTCREGTCGTCEVRVLEGVPEHRDSVLTVAERLENATMMTCVSRCRGSRLVLDV